MLYCDECFVLRLPHLIPYSPEGAVSHSAPAIGGHGPDLANQSSPCLGSGWAHELSWANQRPSWDFAAETNDLL